MSESVLLSLAVRFGIPVDQLNFVACQIIAVLASPLLWSFLHHTKATASTRYAFTLTVGLFLSFFAFGWLAWILLGFTTVCYIMLMTLNPQVVQRVTMFFTLTFLSAMHLHRYFNEDTAALGLELTGPMMVMVQKATSVGFFLHDGHLKDKEKLSASQAKCAISQVPTILEYFSYMLQFHTLLAGPFVIFKDYKEFISGESFTKHKTAAKPGEPSPIATALFKIVLSVFCALIFLTFLPIFPINRLKEEEFLRQTIPYQMMYIYMATAAVRFKYYYAWVFAEAVCNLSGLGFNGYKSDGQADWSLAENVDILGFEFGSSFRDCINSWNKGTNVWLRISVYDRVPKSKGVLLTFALSALWHGFFPGYYLTFFTGALVTVASRTVRSNLRPLFMATPTKKSTYDLLTMLCTRLLMTYTTFSFVILEFWPSVRVYWSMYFWMHFMCVLSIVALPKFLGKNEAPLRNRLSKLVTNSNSVNSLHG